MENQTIPSFIVIDDDPVNNLICHKYIQLLSNEISIQTFTDPVAGIDYIINNYNEQQPNQTLLLLDINMPIMNGWDLLDRFVSFPDAVKQQFKIFILSSSVDLEDKQLA